MSVNWSVFRQPLPSEPRLPTDLPCNLWKDGSCKAARVRNINHSGVQIALSGDAVEVNFRGDAFLEIEGIGAFDVLIKWQRGGRLGLRFADKLVARPLLETWFRASGRFP